MSREIKIISEEVFKEGCGEEDLKTLEELLCKVIVKAVVNKEE